MFLFKNALKVQSKLGPIRQCKIQCTHQVPLQYTYNYNSMLGKESSPIHSFIGLFFRRIAHAIVGCLTYTCLHKTWCFTLPDRTQF